MKAELPKYLSAIYVFNAPNESFDVALDSPPTCVA